MRVDISRYVRNCMIRALNEVEQKPPASLMGKQTEVREPWRFISLDFVCPLPRSKHGNCKILVVTDYFSKYVALFPCRSDTAKALVKHQEQDIFLVYGASQ